MNTTGFSLDHFIDHLAHPSKIEQVLFRQENSNQRGIHPPIPKKYRLARSYPAIVLFLSELEKLYPNQPWESLIHCYIVKIKETIEADGVASLGLFGGLCEFCFAVRAASAQGKRYQKLLATLDAYLSCRLEGESFPSLEQCFQDKTLPRMFQYDLIQGITGIGLYVLEAGGMGSILERILNNLIQLCHPVRVKEKEVPGWMLSPDDPYLKGQIDQFPDGNLNLGLAHGITGVLAFLAIASLKGIQVPGQREAISFLANWLQKYRRGHEGQYFWETVISFGAYTGQTKEAVIPSRDAWCYGTPGVARALFLAGKALNDPMLKEFALESFLSVFSRTREQWHLPGPSLCHGISGLLLITHFMCVDTGSEALSEQRAKLCDLLSSYYKDEHPFGFKDLEPCTDQTFFPVDQLDLLEGAPGIFLTLLSIENPQLTTWHRPLLIHE